jgi:3-oxoacyl-[acyl-carrier-protein] synthase-3
LQASKSKSEATKDDHMKAAIRAIEYYLPTTVLTNAELASDFPEWAADRIEEKLGVAERHIAAPDQCSSDLGIAAARHLFDQSVCLPADIDFLLLCTQSPDYFLPTTACILQDSLGIPKTAGALDFNLGCSGFIYGLGLAKGLIESGQARNVLLITAETYSKFMHPRDKSVRALFGDAAAAVLIHGIAADEPAIGPFVYGTDGSGAQNLIVPVGGLRQRVSTQQPLTEDENGNFRSPDDLYMNGPEIFTFTLSAVPRAFKDLLAKAHLTSGDIDLFAFHQANQYMLEHLCRKLKIPEDKFYVAMRYCGNTVSATIPIVLKHAALDGRLKAGHRVMLVGFGVGYSWGACLIRWQG